MELSKLILGTVQFGVPYGINNPNGKPSANQAHHILTEAYQSGIRLLDTAEAYGNAHEVIGKYHRKYSNNIFEVITKIPSDSTFENINDKFQQYLVDLRVNNLYALMFHSFESYNKNKIYLSVITRLKIQGKIKYAGVSIYSNDELKKVIMDESIDLIQLPFNILDNNTLRGDLIEEAKKRNKIIHTRSVFLQGLFFKDLFDKNPIVVSLHDQLKQIKGISDEYNIPIGALALGYCMAQINIDNVLIGVDSIEQLKSNINIQNFKIPKEAIKKIDKIRIKEISLLNPSEWMQKLY